MPSAPIATSDSEARATAIDRRGRLTGRGLEPLSSESIASRIRRARRNGTVVGAIAAGLIVSVTLVLAFTVWVLLGFDWVRSLVATETLSMILIAAAGGLLAGIAVYRMVQPQFRRPLVGTLVAVLAAALATAAFGLASLLLAVVLLGVLYFPPTTWTLLAILVVAVGGATLLARWTFIGIKRALTPQLIQAMWLRRFQAEGGNAFLVSAIVDRLNRFGISTFTLQDRDVQLSAEQRLARLAMHMWAALGPVLILLTIGFAALTYTIVIAIREPGDPFMKTGEQLLAGFGMFVFFLFPLFFVLLVVLSLLLLTFLSLSGHRADSRDQFRTLPRLLKRVRGNKRPRGSTIIRVADQHWQETVQRCLGVTDIAIIDVTEVTAAISWEVRQALEACGPTGIVLIGRKTAGVPLQPDDLASELLGATYLQRTVTYPASRKAPKQERQRFADELRNAIYAARERQLSEMLQA